MNDRERALVSALDQDYRRMFQGVPSQDQDLFYYLGDNRNFSRTWSAKSGKIPTYRVNQAQYLQRATWKVLTGQDKLASLGWPVQPQLAEELGAAVLPSMDAKRSRLLAGNSMHLGVASVVLLVGLTCFGKA